jgi:hypothetical protein
MHLNSFPSENLPSMLGDEEKPFAASSATDRADVASHSPTLFWANEIRNGLCVSWHLAGTLG